MNFALAAVAFAPGLALGSFLNVLAARVPRHRSIVHPGSACMSCAAPIAWYDNLPVVSYVLLRGRCRSCRTPIGLLYPAVELTAALLVAASVLAFGLTFEAVIASFFCCVLVAISAVDLEHRIVPNVIVLPATAIVLAGADAASSQSRICALRAGGFALPLPGRARLPGRNGHGRCEAGPLHGGRARQDRGGRPDDRDARRADPGALPARPPRVQGTQDGRSPLRRSWRSGR